MVDHSCNVYCEMARPNTSARLVREYAETRPDQTIDLKVDGPKLAEMAALRGFGDFDVESALVRLGARNEAAVLQRGRWVVAPRGEEIAPLELDYQELAAELALRRLNMPYYLSWHTALWHYELIDQQSRRIYAAVTRRKREVKIGLASTRFVQITPRKFFGRVQTDEYETPIWMATPEKAIVDSFDHPALAGSVSTVADAMNRGVAYGTIDPELLVQTAIRFGSPMLNRRLGFFMDLMGIPGAEPLLAHLGRKHATPLVPGGKPAPGTEVDATWRVYRNPLVENAALTP